MTRNVEIIAEVASSHGGSLALAEDFIWAFAEAGADTVKFQMTRVAHLSPQDPQYNWFARSELSAEVIGELMEVGVRAGVRTLFTVNHPAEVKELAALGARRIKVGSGEAMDRDLAAEIRCVGFDEVIVSMGLTHSQLVYGGRTRTKYLGCVTRYPAPAGIAYAMLDANPTLDGWSDHAIGLGECQAAIVAGARIIETHVCINGQARPIRLFEKTAGDIADLRAFADDDPQRFIGRWSYNGR